MSETRGEPLPAEARQQLADQIVMLGERTVANRIGRSKSGVVRAALGCAINPRTRDAIVAYLEA